MSEYQVSLPEALYQALTAQAEAQGISVAALIAEHFNIDQDLTGKDVHHFTVQTKNHEVQNYILDDSREAMYAERLDRQMHDDSREAMYGERLDKQMQIQE